MMKLNKGSSVNNTKELPFQGYLPNYSDLQSLKIGRYYISDLAYQTDKPDMDGAALLIVNDYTDEQSLSISAFEMWGLSGEYAVGQVPTGGGDTVWNIVGGGEAVENAQQTADSALSKANSNESRMDDMGTFTGTTITDNVSIEQALQDLETALENFDGGSGEDEVARSMALNAQTRADQAYSLAESAEATAQNADGQSQLNVIAIADLSSRVDDIELDNTGVDQTARDAAAAAQAKADEAETKAESAQSKANAAQVTANDNRAYIFSNDNDISALDTRVSYLEENMSNFFFPAEEIFISQVDLSATHKNLSSGDWTFSQEEAPYLYSLSGLTDGLATIKQIPSDSPDKSFWVKIE